MPLLAGCPHRDVPGLFQQQNRVCKPAELRAATVPTIPAPNNYDGIGVFIGAETVASYRVKPATRLLLFRFYTAEKLFTQLPEPISRKKSISRRCPVWFLRNPPVILIPVPAPRSATPPVPPYSLSRQCRTLSGYRQACSHAHGAS